MIENNKYQESRHQNTEVTSNYTGAIYRQTTKSEKPTVVSWGQIMWLYLLNFG